VEVGEAGVGSAEWQRLQALLQEAKANMPILMQAEQAAKQTAEAAMQAAEEAKQATEAGSVTLETVQEQLVAFVDEADGKLEATRLEGEAMEHKAASEALNEKQKAVKEQSRKEAEGNQAKRRRLSLGPMGLDGAVAVGGQGQRGVGLSMAALKKWLPCITNADTRNAIVESSGMLVTNIFCILGPGGSGQAVTYEMEKLTTHLTIVFRAEEMHIPSCDVDLLMNGDW
jgi:hypothetical protein